MSKRKVPDHICGRDILILVLLGLSLLVSQCAHANEERVHPVREIVRFAAQMFVPGTVTFPHDTFYDLNKYGIDADLVDEIPKMHPDTYGAYMYATGKIYISKKAISGGRRGTDLIAAHEVVHKLRYENGLWLDHALEEYLAIHLAEYAAKKLFDIKYRLIDPKQAFVDTLEVNGITGFEIDMDVVAVEAAKTKALIDQLVGE